MLVKVAPDMRFLSSDALVLAFCLLINVSFYFHFSERHPGRSDLIVLVAHNDDPTG